MPSRLVLRVPPWLVVCAALAASIGLAACGDDEKEDGASGGGTTARAEELAACAKDAGFDPTIDDEVESGATAVDLTTRTATIVVHVFESADDAAAYAPKATLDAEQVGSVLILGGAIPAAELAKIKACL